MEKKDKLKIKNYLVIVLFITSLVYCNGLRANFIYDDHVLIISNDFIKDIKFIPQIFKTHLHYFDSRPSSYYRPLQSLSYMFDYSLWKLNPFGYHLSNLILHLFNTILVFVIVMRLFNSANLSFLCALFFGVHPVNTAAVTYISGRADTLCTFFVLTSLVLYIAYRRVFREKYFVIAMVCFIFALLSKEIALISPFLFILIDITFPSVLMQKEKNIKKLADYTVILLIVFLYILLRYQILKNVPLVPLFSDGSFFARLMKAPWIIAEYLKLLILPINLRLEHMFFPPESLGLSTILLVIILGVVFILAKIRRSFKVIFFGSFWFIILLFPLIGVIFPLNATIAEHWLYLPSIGFFIVCSYFLNCLLKYKKNRLFGRVLITVVTILCVIIVTCFGAITVKRNREWGDEIAFFRGIIQKNGDIKVDRVYGNLARAYYMRKFYALAEIEASKALLVNPDYPEALCLLGTIDGQKGFYEQSIQKLKKSLIINPYYVEAYYNLGITYAKMGLLEEAIQMWQKAIHINPYFKDAHLSIRKAAQILKSKLKIGERNITTL